MIGGMGSEGHFARQQPSGANVRIGSKADIGARPINVRFTPESGHCLDTRLSSFEFLLNLVLSLRALAALGEGQKSESASREARGRRGLGPIGLMPFLLRRRVAKEVGPVTQPACPRFLIGQLPVVMKIGNCASKDDRS
jgi:hypothetical protein